MSNVRLEGIEQGHTLDIKHLFAALEGSRHLYARLTEEFDRIVLVEAMRRARGNQARTSEMLGIDRKTLRSKLRNLGLNTSGLPVPPNDETSSPLSPRASLNYQTE